MVQPAWRAVTLQAPFPWFGGKRDVADQVWAALGAVDHYIEPFFGSGAVLLARPHVAALETVNDMDGFLSNFWRAVATDPDAVAAAADWPVNEVDLHARHLWLVEKRGELTARLMGDPLFFDVQAAGWWVWGACAWIGSGWCSGQGPWVKQDGRMVDRRQLPHLSAGQGVNRQLPHLSGGQGVNRSSCGADRLEFMADWFRAISLRMRGVRVACGDWSRVLGPSVRDAGGGKWEYFLIRPIRWRGDPLYMRLRRPPPMPHASGASRTAQPRSCG